MQIHLNGRLIDQSRARVSHDDAGFQHGVGLFETLTARHGRPFRLRAHLDRLFNSAAALGLELTTTAESLDAAVASTLDANGLTEARIRITITPGRLNLLRADRADASPTVLVAATPPTIYDPAYFERGITATVAAAAANPMDPFAGHKTVAYWHRLYTLRKAASLGAAEAIWLNVSNHLASGAVSNLFLVHDGVLLTPPARGEEPERALPSPVLPGITRAAVIESAATSGIDVRRQMLTISDLLDADEVFLTNSGWQVLPVTTVERKKIGEGRVGPVTCRVRETVLALIDEETTS